MSTVSNLLNEEILVDNIKVAAYFVLIYEHFKDDVINTVKDICFNIHVLDGEYYTQQEKYIKKLRTKVKNNVENPKYKALLCAAEREMKAYESEVLNKTSEKDSSNSKIKLFQKSLRYLQMKEVFSEQDVKQLDTIRKRRNAMVHDLIETLEKGITESDISMIGTLFKCQLKLSQWKFKEFEIPIMGYEDITNDIMSGEDALIIGIFQILFLNEGGTYKNELNRQMDFFKANT